MYGKVLVEGATALLESLETEKCQFCGASVKKENLRGHYERVHPNRGGSMAPPKSLVMSTPFFRSHRRRTVLVVAILVLAVVGASVAAQQFANSNTMQMHWHPQLSATINGTPYTIPKDIGTPMGSWMDHSLDQYGMSGMSPLHTHDASGQIHEESNTVRDFTLQEFLVIWGQHLDSGRVLGHLVDTGHRAYIVVDGVEKSGALDVVLANGQKIQIVCGP